MFLRKNHSVTLNPKKKINYSSENIMIKYHGTKIILNQNISNPIKENWRILPMKDDFVKSFVQSFNKSLATNFFLKTFELK